MKTTICCFLLLLAWPAPAAEKAKWWSAEVEQALTRSAENRGELEKALTAVPKEQRAGLAFLIANMSPADLQALRSDFLLENVHLAYQARREVPWGAKVPEEIFFNDVLPYAQIDEARHAWRADFHKRFLPMVKDCKTPAEAAHRLNSTIFKELRVRYSTARKLPNQSPKETVESGIATCTGLSVVLADACRSVAIPARLAGTAQWADREGNHTWVEIWDQDWHFAGAAEPDPKGLDRGWFAADAARAKKGSRLEAIYAVSFRKRDTTFPLVWAPDRKDVYAVNVTDRYAKSLAAAPAGKPVLSDMEQHRIEQAARDFFAAPEKDRAAWKFDVSLDRLLARQEEAVRRAVWKAYREAPIHDALKKDFEKNQVRHESYLSAYTLKRIGKKPEGGWPLFIALHGGGGAPKALNDQQWQIMQHYYQDQRSVTGYQYLALRAPNDAWNGFYDGYMLPLTCNLIRQFLLFGDVDPDKVFLMGYSHGGYGAFYIGPKMPDRFAAIHSSAAAPTGGTISPKALRNTRFSFMVGEFDTDYGRRKRCEEFNETIRKLREQDKDDYPVVMELKKGHGHGDLPDRGKIKDLYPFTRNPVPRHLSWELKDSIVNHFFWLTVPEPSNGQELDAKIEENAIRIVTRNVKEFDLNLDSRLVAIDKPVRILVDGKSREVPLVPRFSNLCRSLLERGDPRLAWTCRVHLKPGDQ